MVICSLDAFEKVFEGERNENKEGTQPAHDVLGTSPEGPLKVLTPKTYKAPSGDPQGTNTKTDNSMGKLLFRSNSPCIT